jgi:hypothetical protein
MITQFNYNIIYKRRAEYIKYYYRNILKDIKLIEIDDVQKITRVTIRELFE